MTSSAASTMAMAMKLPVRNCEAEGIPTKGMLSYGLRVTDGGRWLRGFEVECEIAHVDSGVSEA